MKDSAGDADEWNDENELERVDDVIAQLRGRNVEAEDKGQGEAEDGSAPQEGIDADEEADGHAPGKLFRRRSHAKQREDGKSDAAVDPVVLDDRGTIVGDTVVGLVGQHS